jgi:phosphatidate cytidylyltransferase
VIKRVATAVVLIPIVLLIVLRAPLWLFAAVVGLVALITTCEYLGLADACGIKPAKILTYLLTALLFASAVVAFIAEAKLSRLPSSILLRGALPKQHPYIFFTLNAASLARDSLLLAALVLLVAMLTREDLRSALPGAAVSALGLAYISLPFMLLITVRARAAGAFYVFYLLVVVWVGDILAFLIGGSIGKHKLAPGISPNKSWEGTVASLAGGTAVGTVILLGAEGIVSFLRSSQLLAAQWGSILSVGSYPPPRPVWVYVLLSAAINVAAQLGDLVESMLKRGAGVKDSGSLLPGHGGMLDRIDALLFAAPVLWYYAQIAAAIGPR